LGLSPNSPTFFSLFSIFYERSELVVFGSGVELIGVQLPEYPKLFLGGWICVPDLIGDEYLKTGSFLDFPRAGSRKTAKK